jgi:hypothetical protein
METKFRGINLGCGTKVLPRAEKLPQHNGIPDDIYFNTLWDNVDINAAPGVDHTIDLFTYPWALPSETYDIAIASHIVEHIPHYIVWNGADWGPYTLARFSPDIQEFIRTFGQLIPCHPVYGDGWYAWFGELWRIMKPGGRVYVAAPWGWSHGAIGEPQHSRYLNLVTFNYFNPSDDYVIRMGQAWDVNMQAVVYTPHSDGLMRAKSRLGLESHNWETIQTCWPILNRAMHRELNVVQDFTVTLTKVALDEAGS